MNMSPLAVALLFLTLIAAALLATYLLEGGAGKFFLVILFGTVAGIVANIPGWATVLGVKKGAQASPR